MIVLEIVTNNIKQYILKRKSLKKEFSEIICDFLMCYERLEERWND